MNWKETRAEYMELGQTSHVGRPALVMEFYGKGEELAPHGEAILELCLDIIPPELKGGMYALSSSQYKKVTPQMLRRMRKEFSELRQKARFYALTTSPDCTVGDYSFELNLGNTQPLSNNLVFVAWPIQQGDAAHAESAVAFFERMLNAAPFWGAIAGYGFDIVWGREFEQAAMPVNFALARRYQGLLVRDRLQSMALPQAQPPAAPRPCIPSVAWLTYLGTPLLEQLGGRKALEVQLQAAGLSSRPLGPGVLVRTGATPPEGDVNRQDPDLLPLRVLDRALRPVILERWFLSANLLGVDRDTASEWLHRFEP